jgi:hypothetical protein
MDELGPWSIVVVERIGDAFLIDAQGPMRRSIAEEVYDRLDAGEPLDRPFDPERVAVTDEGRVILIASGLQAAANLFMADSFAGLDPDARWEKAAGEVHSV